MKIKYINSNFDNIINNKNINQTIFNTIKNLPSLNIVLNKNLLEETKIVSNQFKKNKDKIVIFGTGGETIQGNLWIANLNELMDEDLSNAVPLISNSQLGYLAPPSIGDLNSDHIKDIVVQGFDGKISAINGADLSILWQYEISYTNTESQASPILGKFSYNNYNLDVFATIFKGASSDYSDFYQVLIDGETGNELWIDSLGLIPLTTNISTPNPVSPKQCYKKACNYRRAERN